MSIDLDLCLRQHIFQVGSCLPLAASRTKHLLRALSKSYSGHHRRRAAGLPRLSSRYASFALRFS